MTFTMVGTKSTKKNNSWPLYLRNIPGPIVDFQWDVVGRGYQDNRH